MRYQWLLVLLIFGLMACDELFTSQGNSEDSQIVWIGNGALSLTHQSGVVAKRERPDGSIETVFVGNEGIEAFTLDESSDEYVPTRLRWAAENRLFQLKQLSTERLQDCEHFESLEDGTLMCREDFEKLKISHRHPPRTLDDGSLVYLDREYDLYRWSEEGTEPELLAQDVRRFLAAKGPEVFYQGLGDLTWRRALKEEESPFLLGRSQRPLLDEEGRLYVFIKQPQRGVFSELEQGALYRWEGHRFETVETLPEGWELLHEEVLSDRPEPEDFQEEFFRIAQDQEEGRETYWVKVTPDGFQKLDENFLDTEEGPDLIEQGEGNLSLVKQEGEEGLSVGLCRSSEEGEETREVTETCEPLLTEESFYILDAVVIPGEKIYLFGENQADVEDEVVFSSELRIYSSEGVHLKSVALDEPIWDLEYLAVDESKEEEPKAQSKDESEGEQEQPRSEETEPAAETKTATRIDNR